MAYLRMSRRYQEHYHQKDFVAWFKMAISEWIFAVPNAGKRNPREASWLKAEGLIAGVPDLYCPIFKLWIEMKPEKGYLSKEQKKWKDHLEQDVGDNYIVGFGFEDAQRKTIEVVNSLEHNVNTNSSPRGGDICVSVPLRELNAFYAWKNSQREDSLMRLP